MDSEVFAEGSAKGSGAGPAIKLTPTKGGRFANARGIFRGASKLTANKKRKKSSRNGGVAFASVPGGKKKAAKSKFTASRTHMKVVSRDTAHFKNGKMKPGYVYNERTKRHYKKPTPRRESASMKKYLNSSQALNYPKLSGESIGAYSARKAEYRRAKKAGR